jgi:hypothetical protein
MRATLAGNRRVQAWIALGLVVMVFGFVLGIVSLASNTTDAQATDRIVCKRLNTFDSVLLTILNRSLKGLPSNPYYRDHPRELEVALMNTQYAIGQLEHARC